MFSLKKSIFYCQSTRISFKSPMFVSRVEMMDDLGFFESTNRLSHRHVMCDIVINEEIMCTLFLFLPVRSKRRPAIGGPTVNGTEHIPSKKPIAWVAPFWPHMSKAIGPRSDMKHPSNSPMHRAMSSRTPNEGVTGSSIVKTPILTNEIYWIQH